MGRTGKKYLGASVRETEVRALKKKRKAKEEEEEFFAGRVDLSLSSFPSFAVIALLSHIIRPPFLLLFFESWKKVIYRPFDYIERPFCAFPAGIEKHLWEREVCVCVSN